jgi:hypothetical protein
MRRPVALAVVTCLALAATAFANFGPPPLPKGRKVVEPLVRFEGIDRHPGHVFYLQYGAVYYGSTLVEVKDAEPIKLDFKAKDRTPVPHVALYAVEREDFGRRKRADPSLKWLCEAKDGVLWVKLSPPETTMPAAARDVPVTTYRVTLEGGKLRADKVSEQKGRAAESSGLLAPWAFGIVSALSIAWLGIWVARKGATSPWAKEGGTAEPS